MIESIRFAPSVLSVFGNRSNFFIIGLTALLLAPLRLAAQVDTFETGKAPITEIHVAESGSDLMGDGSLQSPYASIGRAARDAAPGSAIRVHPGNYTGENVVEDLAGTRAHPIWIGGVPGEAKPIVVGGEWGLFVDRARFLVVHDFEVRGASTNGISVADGGEYGDFDAARYLVLRDLEIYDIGGTGNQDCLKLSGVNNYFVLRSVFARCGGASSGSGIDCVGCHDGHIEGNRFYSMSHNAVQTKGGSENIRIHRNIVIDGGTVAFHIGGATGYEYFRPPLSTVEPNYEARNIQVTANVVVGGRAALSFIGAVDSLAANNTIVNPEHWLIRILQATTGGVYVFLACGDNTVANNLFYFNQSQLSAHVNIGPDTDADSFVFSNNLWYAHDNYMQSQPILPVRETDSLVGRDPLMVAPTSSDYRLQSASPAIGSGQPITGLEDDFDGVQYTDPPSIGAFEY